MVGSSGGDSLVVRLLAERGIRRVHVGCVPREASRTCGVRETNCGIKGAHAETPRRGKGSSVALGTVEGRARSSGRDSLRQRRTVLGPAENRARRGNVLARNCALHIEERSK